MPNQTKKQPVGSAAQHQIVIHPVLFALNPVIFLYAQSFPFVDVWAIVRSSILSVAIAAVLWGLLWFLLRNVQKAALLTSIALTMFFAYGAGTEELAENGLFPAAQWIPGADLLVLGCAAGVWVGIALLLKKRNLSNGWTYFANVFGTVAVVFPLAVVAQHAYAASVVSRAVGWSHEDIPVAGEAAVMQTPDIYWVLPDTYARADILADVYGYDDEPFLDALRDRGFTISPHAVSNYSTTVHSVASALNLDYMHNLVSGPIEEIFDWRFARHLVFENRMARFLGAQGYRTYSVASQYDNIDWPAGERESRWWFLNHFESTLMGRTSILPLSRMIGFPVLEEHHRARTRHALEWLSRAADLPGPKFVFVQLVTPHPPFIFGPGGEAINPPRAYSWAEGFGFWTQPGASREEYREGYLNQVRYLHKPLLDVVDAIQDSSEQPPVIVILSDHGPASGDWVTDLSRPEVIERFGVLSALALPGADPGVVADDLAVVNVFRLILNQYFDTELALFESENFYIQEHRPYDYIPVELPERHEAQKSEAFTKAQPHESKRGR